MSAGSTESSRLAAVLVALGVLTALWGVAYDVAGITQAPAGITVPVAVAPANAAGAPDTASVQVPDVTVQDGWLAPAQASGVRLGSVDGYLSLHAWRSTRTEQALARGDWMLGGAGLLAMALLLRPVLRSTAAGRPFIPGNAGRLLGAGAVIAVIGTAAPLLPELAGALVLNRTGLDESGMLVPALAWRPVPLLVGTVVAALAAAFRHGEQLVEDAEGTV
ncbi:hypothetical protein Q6348_15195 [Isoptericola sp. b441]|uniref:DUF2975 domain-containing protein n=1 Tax=Actinotalea lenta TaxID=3064654 RepID=A0ABT9DCD7_9CELL|nr:hypothetical protein [Isoptericola sp. b441]MDO8108542.1 hypothetical protein [Isoptericola sp. b441]